MSRRKTELAKAYEIKESIEKQLSEILGVCYSIVNRFLYGRLCLFLYISINFTLIIEQKFGIINSGTFNKLGGAKLLTKGGDKMNKKDFLIFALVIIIFLLLLLLFTVLI